MKSKLFLLVFLYLFQNIANAQTPERLLFLGNSITWHTPNPSLGWSGNWGMAASSQNKDYVHLVGEMLAKSNKNQQPIVYPRNVSDIENSSMHFELDRLDFISSFHPSSIIVFLGDNVKSNKHSEETFAKRHAEILSKSIISSSPKIYCVTTWWKNHKVDKIIAENCLKVGGKLIDIGDISTINGMRADAPHLYENSGVASHPSDFGMHEIAKKIFDALRQ